MKLRLLLDEDEEDFDFQIFECVDRALSSLGNAEKELVLKALASEYYLSGVDIAANPSKFEQCLTNLLGKAGSEYIFLQILNNICRSFRISLKDDCNLAEAISTARREITSKKEAYANLQDQILSAV